MQSVVADHVAVVAGEHHDGVVGEMKLVESRQQAAEVPVHGMDRGEVKSRPLFDLVEVRSQGRRDGGIERFEWRRVLLRHRVVRQVRLAEMQA